AQTGHFSGFTTNPSARRSAVLPRDVVKPEVRIICHPFKDEQGFVERRCVPAARAMGPKLQRAYAEPPTVGIFREGLHASEKLSPEYLGPGLYLLLDGAPIDGVEKGRYFAPSPLA